MLRDGFGFEATIIPMPCDGPSDKEFTQALPPVPGAARVLWLARINPQKRPDRFLELAESCPEYRFDLVGPGRGDGFERSIRERAKEIPNLVLHGAVAREEVARYYKEASVMCCTSDFEGFPNTFLEAWSHGLPIVSTFDPDGLIAARDLGSIAGDVSGLAIALRNIVSNPVWWLEASRNARRYFTENHALESTMPRFEAVFIEAADKWRFERI